MRRRPVYGMVYQLEGPFGRSRFGFRKPRSEPEPVPPPPVRPPPPVPPPTGAQPPPVPPPTGVQPPPTPQRPPPVSTPGERQPTPQVQVPNTPPSATPPPRPEPVLVETYEGYRIYDVKPLTGTPGYVSVSGPPVRDRVDVVAHMRTPSLIDSTLEAARTRIRNARAAKSARREAERRAAEEARRIEEAPVEDILSKADSELTIDLDDQTTWVPDQGGSAAPSVPPAQLPGQAQQKKVSPLLIAGGAVAAIGALFLLKK